MHITKLCIQIHGICLYQVLRSFLFYIGHVSVKDRRNFQIIKIPLSVVHLAVADLKERQNIRNGSVQNIFHGRTVAAEGSFGDQNKLRNLRQALTHVLEAIFDDAGTRSLQPTSKASNAVPVDLIGIDKDVFIGIC